MPNFKIIATSIVAAGLFLAVSAPAQQSPAANSTPPAAKPASSTKAAHTTGAKPSAHTAAKPKAAPLALTTQAQKVSYAIGMGLGKNLHRDSVEIDTAALLRGLKDALAGSQPLLTDDEAKAAITQLQAEVRAKEAEKMKVEALENKMKGDTFLAANKTKEGVVTLPSGLQYKVLTPGTGPKPAADDIVVCNYRGTLVDGTEFDSSYKRGEPIKIPVKEVIKGWTEAIQLMPVGSKWQIYIPSDLAYGDRGAPGSPIGPNSALIFDVELLSIEPKPAPAPAKEAPKEQPKEAAPANPQPKEQAPPNPKP
ncbi:MAG TPA: FKBP-type peptidyl-prolyl cis-trans isomerase [Candidatus Eisenbacteria bacterium]|nr:FKBP-type peptidyl-prolyl cis-trans isomerase [Candidatus Eisenbacteria bacterium]